MEAFTILAFDPALRTGWSVLWYRQDKPIYIIASGIVDISKIEGYGYRLDEFRKQIADLLYLYKPTFIIAEEVTFAMGNHIVKRLHAGLRGIIALETYRYNRVEANFISANTARKTIGAGGGAKKPQVAKFLQAMGMIEEKPVVNWGDYDVTDSIALGVALITEVKNDKHS